MIFTLFNFLLIKLSNSSSYRTSVFLFYELYTVFAAETSIYSVFSLSLMSNNVAVSFLYFTYYTGTYHKKVYLCVAE